MEPWVSCILVLLAAGSASGKRHLAQKPVYSICPDVSISPFKGATKAPPAGTPVQYSDLRGLGWDAPASRASTTTAATTAALDTSDFWSVACGGSKGVKAERTSCTTASDLAGAVHVRHDCTDASFWVLVYSLTDIKYGTTAAGMWAANQCGDVCEAKDTAFLRYSGNATAGSCGVTCSGACPATGPCWCCSDMWPIVDNAAGWVGWMAKVSFSIAAGASTSYDKFMASFKWGAANQPNANSIAYSADGDIAVATACMRLDCPAAPVCTGNPTAPAGLNVTLNCPSPAAPNSVCSTQCPSGYTGTVSATCQANGTYTGVTSTCAPIVCTGNPTVPAGLNVTLNCPSPAAPSSLCSAQCPSGYTGTVSATCQADGTYTGVTSTCAPIVCTGNPTAPAGLNVTLNCRSPAAPSSVCSTQCPSGFSGSPYATCQADGTYSAVTGECLLIDIGVNLTDTPDSQLLGSAYSYTVKLTNLQRGTSKKPNTFRVELPAGVEVDSKVKPDHASPGAACDVVKGDKGNKTVTCTVDEDISEGTTWSFTLSANITTAGDKEAVVKLNKPDNNPSNDKDATTTKAFITCAAPHGQLASRPSCEEGRYYTGFDGTRLAKAEDFQDTCCVAPSTCPAGYRQPLRAPTADPAAESGPVQWSALSALGWEVGQTRLQSSANASAGDFWDVMCVSFGQGQPTRVACDKSPTSGAGAVHVRYDCAKKTFWVLTYVFSSYRFSDNAGDIWAVKECTEAGDQWCEANDRKFLQYDPQRDGCSGSCPPTCTTPTACWCCNDMWIIEDGNAGPVGWMAKASFDLRQNSTTSWDAMMLHFDWGDTALGETGSSSSGAAGTANPGICFNCTAGEPRIGPPPPPPPPIDVAVNISANPTNGLLGSAYVYTITMSNMLNSTSVGNNGFLITLPPGVETLGQVTPETGAPTPCLAASCVATGSVLNCTINQPLNAEVMWTFTLQARASTLGDTLATVQLLQPDSNPSNDADDAAVSTFVTCGAPFGLLAARPACPSGQVYRPSLAATQLLASGDFNATCCAEPASVPGDAGIKVSPGVVIQLTTTTTHTFTIRANGEGTSKEVSVSIGFPNAATAGLQAATVYGSDGSKVSSACGTPASLDGGSAALSCNLGDLQPSATVRVVLMFKPTAEGTFSPITGNLSANSDTVELNNTASTSIKVLDCPPYQGIVGQACQVKACKPCPDANPTVYLSTGGGATVNPKHGLWRIKSFDITRTDMVPELLCVIDDVEPAQVGDIAMLHTGDLVVLDTSGNLRYIPAANMPETGTTDYDNPPKCGTLFLYQFDNRYAGYTGLSVGFRSDMLVASTGDGWVVPLQLTQAPGDATRLLARMPQAADVPVRWGCWYSGTPTNPSLIENKGGTDITPGPDGNFYRWSAQDGGMEYVGSRISTVFRDGYNQLTSTSVGTFTHHKLGNQVAGKTAPYNNAGSFCTSKSVIGAGAFNAPPINNVPASDSGNRILFWQFGYVNGAQVRGFGLNILSRVSALPAAPVSGSTVRVLNPDGSVRTDVLRVNGAAIRPRCNE